MSFSVTISHKGIDSKQRLTKLKDRLRSEQTRGISNEIVGKLSAATPVRTGKTAASWNCDERSDGGKTVLNFTNSNMNKGSNIATLIQYGHGTGTGGYVQGIDYINPVLKDAGKSVRDRTIEIVRGS